MNSDSPTNFTVYVTKDGLPVERADVTITSSSGVYRLLNSLPGRWEGHTSVYDEVYVLDVNSGDDNVQGVRIDGPDIHIVTAPANLSAVDTTMPLTIEWSRLEDTETASLNFSDVDGPYPPILAPDSGSYSIAPGTLKTFPDRQRGISGSLGRDIVVTPTGGADGSLVRVIVLDYLGLVADPKPL